MPRVSPQSAVVVVAPQWILRGERSPPLPALDLPTPRATRLESRAAAFQGGGSDHQATKGGPLLPSPNRRALPSRLAELQSEHAPSRKRPVLQRQPAAPWSKAEAGRGLRCRPRGAIRPTPA